MSIYHDQLISIRRQLHQNPEEGWSEFTTTAFLVKTLRGYGYQVLLGRNIIDPDACLGREMSVVKAGIERARKTASVKSFLRKCRNSPGAWPFWTRAAPAPRLRCALTLTASL